MQKMQKEIVSVRLSYINIDSRVLILNNTLIESYVLCENCKQEETLQMMHESHVFRIRHGFLSV